uniref:Platelet-derived growth factor subunit B n=1 Tax=Sinocyclocheilus grahami TaxID=75366 RepID=A0A672SFR3_SINGR
MYLTNSFPSSTCTNQVSRIAVCFACSSCASVCISASLSADAQPAQQAICKVRTEVIEVTRSMLDRSNANFLLWPPCVEVQRCSGCCNTKSLQCVPVLTHTRYLQVMKIQYVNKRPLYDKAVVAVLDHVECRCQPAPRPPQRRKSSGHKQEGRERFGKPRPKDEHKKILLGRCSTETIYWTAVCM